MHAGYLFVFLSLISYSSLGVLHKVAEVKQCRAESISLLMCVWSVVLLSCVQLTLGRTLLPPASVAKLAIPLGMCAGMAILSLQTALSLGDISTSWLAVNLSAGIPAVLSIVLYHESIGWKKISALIAMVLAMVLLWKDSRDKRYEPEIHNGSKDRTGSSAFAR